MLVNFSNFRLHQDIQMNGSMNYYNIIELIIIIWLFDTFSFLGGKIIGGAKLMPSISSGKTISGLLIGIFATLLSFYIYTLTINEFSIKYLFFSIFSTMFSILSTSC